MADVSGIINAIEAAIYTNGAELITGDILQAVLEAMVNGLNTLKEDTLIFDNTPTNGSDNPVKSGGVYSALQGKQDTLSDGDNISTINGESLLTGDPITINASKSETVVGSLGESLFLGISQAAPHSFRIDINATYNSTPNSNLIGSIIVAVCYDAGWQAEAYYYGSTLADLVSKVAIYEDNGDYYLVVSLKSQDLTEPFYFTVTPLDENTLDASAVEIDTQTLVETITPTELGAGGGGVTPVTSWQNPPTDTDVPSEKLVKNSIDAADKVFVATYGSTTYADIAAAGAAGKICVCHYNGADYVLSRTESSYVMFGAAYDNYIKILKVTSANVWSSDMNGMQYFSYRKSSWSATPSDSNYPSEKLVYDSLGKKGVISQTQTWSGTGSNPRTYVMSGQVTGLIPQSFIDMAVSAGATFNPNGYQTGVGYFELNGLTDISYEEMRDIYNKSIKVQLASCQELYAYATTPTSYPKMRTNLPLPNFESDSNVNISKIAYRNSYLESLAFANGEIRATQVVYLISNAYCVRYIKGVVDVNSVSSANYLLPLINAYSLEEVYFKNVKFDTNIRTASRLTPASVAYMINNVGTTSAITITLHATAYAAATADADVTAALAAHTNVSLAQAS